MGISMFGIGSNLLSSKNIGQVWKPKSQRLVVGRDVSPISASAFGEEERRMVIANGDDVRFTSTDLFGIARNVAKSGLRAKNFRSVDTRDIVYSNDPNLTTIDPLTGETRKLDHATLQSNLNLVAKRDVLTERGDKFVTFSNNTLQVWQKNQDGTTKMIAQEIVTSDTRLSWDKNNNAVITTGSQARTEGKLKALEDGEILFRTSGVDVEAGEGSTVVNLSDKAGKFSGGTNVTYLGSYGECEITGGAGTTEYAGYFDGAAISGTAGRGVFSGVFENLTIEAGKNADSFSGYFSATTVNGGDGDNDFGGMFLNGSSTTGGADRDTFQGRFIDSLLDAGEGNNRIGRRVSLNEKKRIVTEAGKEYEGIESDLVNSSVTAGSGKDTLQGVIWGGTVNLGDGDNTASGIFSEARITAGKGNDSLYAMYSRLSTFDAGDGNDTVSLATAFSSTVRTGEGTTGVTLGQNIGESSKATGRSHGGDGYLAGSLWQTGSEFLERVGPKDYGELGGNVVNAEAGDNVVTVNNGHGSQTVSAGDNEESEKDAREAEKTGDTAVAEEAKLGQTLQTAQDTLSLMEGTAPSREAGTEDQTGAELKKRRTAIGRYVRQSGDGIGAHGSTGVTVKTGAGEDIDIRTYSSMNTPEMENKGFVHRVTRRNTGFGYYQWEKEPGMYV